MHSADPGQPCGVVVNAAQDETGQWAALAALKIALAGQAGLHLGAADGPEIVPGTLPYVVIDPE
ncbi:hypothetical protein GALL_469540 [mine drainage metagenome]|uniref:Uncharacterized protein n=1 Tax=mine drainage metagenome TaxID=410659 RepID=A0A1J5PJR9_9ZZZZ